MADASAWIRIGAQSRDWYLRTVDLPRLARYIRRCDAGATTNTRHIEEQMATTKRIGPCLWFDDQAEEAAKYYTGIFRNSRVVATTHYGKAGFDTHHRAAGSVMTVAFELDGEAFIALNGGPFFTFNEALSLVVYCATQAEIDDYWEKLSAGGDPRAQQCGWLKDKYGVSWQVVPSDMDELFADAGSPAAERAMEAMLKMKKIDIAVLRRAHDGAA